MKYLPKILFAKDDSFEYAEKIENLIKQTNKQENKQYDEKSRRIKNAREGHWFFRGTNCIINRKN